MGLLSTKDKTPEENRIEELMSRPLHKSVKPHLKQTLKNMAKNGKSIDEIEEHYRRTAAKTNFIENRREEYVTEAKLADEVYKAYITDGLSRLDKVNGRFLASQSIKTDILIEQNNQIIKLLEILVNNGNTSLPMIFCPECGVQNKNASKYCEECGSKI